MGAGPGEAFVSLALPPGFGQASALELVAAMRTLAERQGVAIAGGDVVSAPLLAVTVSVTGWSGAADRLLYPPGAPARDAAGGAGGAARGGAPAGGGGGGRGGRGGGGGGRRALRGGVRGGALVARPRRPEPLLATGLALAGAGVSAMIDVSDGLATDAGHLARASDVT